MSGLALFDLDNTLIRRDDAFRRWARRLIAEHGLDRAELDWLIAADQSGFAPRDQFLAAVGARLGLPGPVCDIAEYHRGMEALIEIRPTVVAGITRLRSAGWQVGVVTNGDAVGQRGKLLALGLPELVDGWVVSGIEGVHKPDRRIFEIAAERCGVELTAGGWMVGDNRLADIAGGHGCGLRTIWIAGFGPQQGGPDPDHVVTDVLDAFEILHGTH